jgi:hypothetical protein
MPLSLDDCISIATLLPAFCPDLQQLSLQGVSISPAGAHDLLQSLAKLTALRVLYLGSCKYYLHRRDLSSCHSFHANLCSEFLRQHRGQQLAVSAACGTTCAHLNFPPVLAWKLHRPYDERNARKRVAQLLVATAALAATLQHARQRLLPAVSRPQVPHASPHAGSFRQFSHRWLRS